MFRIFPLHLQSRRQKSTPISKTRVKGSVSFALGISLLCTISVFGLQAGEVGKDQTGETRGKQQSKSPAGDGSNKSNEKPHAALVPTANYVATAYSLKGRTSSGRMISRGLIAADPRVLPLGSHVRLEAGAYSGEYLVADTGGVVRGRRLEIWTPSSLEAMRFGRRTVRLTILSYENRSPVIMRQKLEKQYQEEKITASEYQIQYAYWAKIAEEALKASAQYYAKHPKLYHSAIYMPAKFAPTDPNETTFLDTYHERFRLEIDLARNMLSQTEYNERLSAIVAEEKVIASNSAHTPSDVAHYFETTAKIQPTVALLQHSVEGRQRWTFDAFVKVAAIVLGIALPFFLAYKKDRREKRILELEKRKLELAEVNSLETVEKTRLLLETRQFQVEEMKLRIAQMEQQLGGPPKRLILP